jgi:hypothetical protein
MLEIPRKKKRKKETVVAGIDGRREGNVQGNSDLIGWVGAVREGKGGWAGSGPVT